RSNVPPGTPVLVVQKQHQRSGELTRGTVARNLTNSGVHPRGQKVMLVVFMDVNPMTVVLLMEGTLMFTSTMPGELRSMVSRCH
ncbi:hypothetical protein JKP88DRAFT_175327, partial [Tribonema minus]